MLEIAAVERSLQELMVPSGRTDRTKFRDQVLRPLIEAGLLELTIPEKPRSPQQRYRATAAAQAALKEDDKKEEPPAKEKPENSDEDLPSQLSSIKEEIENIPGVNEIKNVKDKAAQAHKWWKVLKH